MFIGCETATQMEAVKTDCEKLLYCRKITGGIYHKVQVELTHNSNRIERSRPIHDQVHCIYEMNIISADKAINVDDILETANH